MTAAHAGCLAVPRPALSPARPRKRKESMAPWRRDASARATRFARAWSIMTRSTRVSAPAVIRFVSRPAPFIPSSPTSDESLFVQSTEYLQSRPPRSSKQAGYQQSLTLGRMLSLHSCPTPSGCDVEENKLCGHNADSQDIQVDRESQQHTAAMSTRSTMRPPPGTPSAFEPPRPQLHRLPTARSDPAAISQQKKHAP